jgi:LAO/AO transport system kinase
MMETGLNPEFKPTTRKIVQTEELFQGLRSGDKNALATAITYVESNNPEQSSIGKEILKKCFPFSGKSRRIGITGVPGAGKSTFIESIGKTIAAGSEKMAVLAIDPSSTLHKGSILGDKTRMQELSVLPNVFIRPSPSGNELGGVARNTFEAMILCEAAGYNYIFIETVGVGQSETEVKFLTDCFVLLLISGAGDELQGIKRGIMEMADLMIVNKADGSNLEKAKKTAIEIKTAMHIAGLNYSGNEIPVQLYSSTENTYQKEVLNYLEKFFSNIENSDKIHAIRSEQQLHLFQKTLQHSLIKKIIDSKNLTQIIREKEELIRKNQLSAFEAADDIIDKI